MRWLGIDVGGANLKLADGRGEYARAHPLALWREPEHLAPRLRAMLDAAPPCDGIAATMTGELADCYETKAVGVRHITGALQEAAVGRPLAVYCVDGEFRDADDVHESPLAAAASNWHALARFASRYLPDQTGVVIDVGSTTTDVVPVAEGRVATSSRTDTERLLAGELIYTGVARTPICAVVDRLPYRGAECPVAAELFATTADVYYLLEGRRDSGVATADGRPMTEQSAIDRLARQLCADRDSYSRDDALAASRAVRSRQLAVLRAALAEVSAEYAGTRFDVVISGSGEFLAHQLVSEHEQVRAVVRLSAQLGEVASAVAPAMAVARLAEESWL